MSGPSEPLPCRHRDATLKRFPNGLFGDPVRIRFLVLHSYLHQARAHSGERKTGVQPLEFPEREAVMAMSTGLTNKRDR